MKNPRPVNLDLFKLKYPLMAIVSILHRITGLILVLCVPAFIWLMSYSLTSEAQFECLRQVFHHPLARFVNWALLSFVAYHLLAGIRHIVMDFGFGESVGEAKRSATVLLVLSVAAAVALGAWIW